MTEFFEEVEEQLRSDRYRTIFTRGWPYVVGAAVGALVIALGVWGYQSYAAAQAAKASETYAQGLDAAGKGDLAGADTAFAEVARSGPSSYKALALMQQGAIRLTRKQPAEAVALFDQAAKASSSPVLSDAAQLKAVYVLMDTAPYAEIDRRIQPLTAAKRPYRALAQEALGMAKLGAGKIAEAKSDFSQLLLALDAPEAVRNRAQAVQILIASGTAGAVGAVAKAAATLPPAPPAPPPSQLGPPQSSSSQGAPSDAAPPQPATPAGAPQ